MEIGIELTVSMWGVPGARAEVLVGSDTAHVVVVSAHEGEKGFADAIVQVRRALAYLGLCGEMVFDDLPLPLYLDEESRKAAENAIEKFPKGDLTITPTDVDRVRQEAAEQQERINQNLKKLILRTGEEGLRRGLDKEQREMMTLRESLNKPQKEEKKE